MSLTHQVSFSPTSAVQASNSGTVTLERIFPLGKTATMAVGDISFGNLSASGTLALDLFLCLESNVNAASQFYAVTSLNASSASGLAFTSLNAGQGVPLLPYMRMKVSCKAGGAPATIFENIVARLTTD